MKDYYPDRRCLTALRIVMFLIAFLIYFLSGRFIPIELPVKIIRIAALSISAVLGFIYFPLFFRSLKYKLTDAEIIRSGGVFIKTHQSVRYSSIQYITLINSPFSQYTGINFIVFFVYGGQLRLLFLRHEDADEIMKFASIKKREGNSNVS